MFKKIILISAPSCMVHVYVLAERKIQLLFEMQRRGRKWVIQHELLASLIIEHYIPLA